MVAVQPQVRKGRKFEQVLEGARKIFLAQGFEGASVDDIARQAGVSKATLYSYFHDKRMLFLEMAQCECRRHADEAQARVCGNVSIREGLTICGRTLVDLFSSDFFTRMYRIAVAESERFPELGRTFYKNGPLLGRERLVEYLSEAEARGQLHVPDKDLAADQFAELCKSDILARRVFGISDKITQAEKDRVVDGAVQVFLTHYGVRPLGELPAAAS